MSLLASIRLRRSSRWLRIDLRKGNVQHDIKWDFSCDPGWDPKGKDSMERIASFILTSSQTICISFFILAVTDHHEFSGLKQHKLISRCFFIHKCRKIWWVLCLGSHRVKWRCLQNWVFIWRLWGWICSQVTEMQNSVLALVEQRSSFLCWLPARGHSDF